MPLLFRSFCLKFWTDQWANPKAARQHSDQSETLRRKIDLFLETVRAA
jgi:hypothetical protein